MVQRRRDKVFACTGRPVDQYRSIVRSNSLNHRKQVPHRFALGLQPFEFQILRPIGSGRVYSPSEVCGLDERGNAFTEQPDLYRLLQIIGSSLAYRSHRSLRSVVRRHQDHVNRRIKADNLLQHLQPAHLRHHQVRNHQPRTMLPDQLQPLHRASRRINSRIRMRQCRRQQLQAPGVIVDDHNANSFSHEGTNANPNPATDPTAYPDHPILSHPSEWLVGSFGATVGC